MEEVPYAMNQIEAGSMEQVPHVMNRAWAVYIEEVPHGRLRSRNTICTAEWFTISVLCCG